jgi:hypothetical protein
MERLLFPGLVANNGTQLDKTRMKALRRLCRMFLGGCACGEEEQEGGGANLTHSHKRSRVDLHRALYNYLIRSGCPKTREHVEHGGGHLLPISPVPGGKWHGKWLVGLCMTDLHEVVRRVGLALGMCRGTHVVLGEKSGVLEGKLFEVLGVVSDARDDCVDGPFPVVNGHDTNQVRERILNIALHYCTVLYCAN